MHTQLKRTPLRPPTVSGDLQTRTYYMLHFECVMIMIYGTEEVMEPLTILESIA